MKDALHNAITEAVAAALNEIEAGDWDSDYAAVMGRVYHGVHDRYQYDPPFRARVMKITAAVMISIDHAQGA